MDFKKTLKEVFITGVVSAVGAFVGAKLADLTVRAIEKLIHKEEICPCMQCLDEMFFEDEDDYDDEDLEEDDGK